MSTVDGASTPNQKPTRSKVQSSPVTEHSKSAAAKRAVSTTPRELDSPLIQDFEVMDEDVGMNSVGSSQKTSQESSRDENDDISDAPLAGQNTIIQMGYTHPKGDPTNRTGVRVELIVNERLKHIGFNELKAFLNEMGRNFFSIPEGQYSPILCKEINGYPIPKTDKICMFGKVLCKPDILFLKKLFTKAAIQSNLLFDSATFENDKLATELAMPYLVSGECACRFFGLPWEH